MNIEYLRVSVTDRCNLKCLYCAHPDAHFEEKEILTVDEITKIIGLIHKTYGLRKVRLTGGEPLLRGGITDIVSAIKKMGVRDLSMTTNGHLLPEKAHSLKLAGLDRVNISLDTLDPKKYREMTGGGDISRVWKAIGAARDNDLNPVKINMVPVRGINEDEISSFAELTLKDDFHIRFIELMPLKTHPDLCVKKEEMMKAVSGIGRLVRLPFRGGGPSRNFRLEGAKGIIGFISPVSDHFCDYCNRLRLTANGLLRPCLLRDLEIDLKTPVRSGAADEDLTRLIYRAEASKGSPHPPLTSDILKTSMCRIGG